MLTSLLCVNFLHRVHMQCSILPLERFANAQYAKQRYKVARSMLASKICNVMNQIFAESNKENQQLSITVANQD